MTVKLFALMSAKLTIRQPSSLSEKSLNCARADSVARHAPTKSMHRNIPTDKDF
jgi:hypothetical protein